MHAQQRQYLLEEKRAQRKDPLDLNATLWDGKTSLAGPRENFYFDPNPVLESSKLFSKDPALKEKVVGEFITSVDIAGLLKKGKLLKLAEVNITEEKCSQKVETSQKLKSPQELESFQQEELGLTEVGGATIFDGQYDF